MCGYGCGCPYMPWCACDVEAGGQREGVSCPDKSQAVRLGSKDLYSLGNFSSSSF